MVNILYYDSKNNEKLKTELFSAFLYIYTKKYGIFTITHNENFFPNTLLK